MTTTWAPQSGGMTTDAYEIYVDLRTDPHAYNSPLGPYVPPATVEEFSREVNEITGGQQSAWALASALRSRGALKTTAQTRPLPGRGHRHDRLRPKRTAFSRAVRLVL